MSPIATAEFFGSDGSTLAMCSCTLYTSPRWLGASFRTAMGDDAPGPSRGQGRTRKYITVEEAMEEAAAAA